MKSNDWTTLFLLLAASLLFTQPIHQDPTQTITVPVSLTFTYGESPITASTGMLTVVSSGQTITGAQAKATLSLSGGATITSVTGSLKLRFDGSEKKTAPLVLGSSNLATISVSSEELETWDAGAYTSHTLTVATTGGTLTLTYQGGAQDTATYQSASNSVTVTVSEPEPTPTPEPKVMHFAMLQTYGDLLTRIHVNQFNTLVETPLYGYDNWIGQWPGGWGTDWEYLLGSGLQGLLPLYQDETLKALSLAWQPSTSATDQQTMKNIAAGKWDSYIASTAQKCKAFGYPIYIRFGGEMNINQAAGQWAHYPADFVASWKHTVDIFRAQGVTNVQWVWNPNWADDPDGTINFRSYYPGDSYVDWVGIDMYQWNSQDSAWMADPEYELNGLHGDSIYDEYASRKPIAICEYATNARLWEGVDTSDAKRAAWLERFFNAVESRPRIRLVSYYYAYNYNWAFDSSTPLTLGVYQRRIAELID